MCEVCVCVCVSVCVQLLKKLTHSLNKYVHVSKHELNPLKINRII